MKVKITDKAYTALKAAGATENIMQELAAAVGSHPKGKYKVDTFDGLSCLGVPLSWIRDHKADTATVMTRSEAHSLDAFAASGGLVKIRPLF